MTIPRKRAGVLATTIALVTLVVSAPAFAQLDAAEEALATGRYAKAAALTRPLASKGGQLGAKAALVLGRVELETGQYEKAVASARRAARAKSTRAAAHELEGEALLRQGKVREAISALEKSVRAAGDGDGWRARLILARAQVREGNWLAARPLFDAIADGYNDGAIDENDPEDMMAVAAAVVALEYFQDGNETFAAATKLDPSRVETQTEWARLFLQKYDPGHAEECVRDALKANPNHAEAHLLMAKVRMAQGFNFVGANEELDAALETNPNLAEAYAFRATLQVRDRLWEAAQKNLDRALEIDETNPYALGVRAATYYIADDQRGYQRTLSKLRSRDRRYTGHLRVMNELLEWEHRYQEIVELNREALELDPSYSLAHGVIGLNLLRMGEDEAGVEALQESWNHDQFNVLVFNTLNLYENELSKEYSYVKRGPIRYRFHKNDREVLERYLPELLSRGYSEMSKRYGLRPVGTTVEVFVSEDHFARRSVGLPRVGVQGICFGKVVVAGGPRATPVNYGQVLWHELGHVFTIQLSKSRVPRWFTEGTSVHEETLGNKNWGRHDDAALYRWMKAGRMPAVESLNTAFSRARSGAEIGLAYYGSAKLVEHIKARHGWNSVLRMLREFGRGKRTDEVVRRVLKMEPAELDREFQEATYKRLSHYADNFQVDYSWHYDVEALTKAVKQSPNDAKLLGRAAVAALSRRNKQAAVGFASKAIALEAGQPEARHVLSDIGAAMGNVAEATKHAEALIERGVDGYGLRLNLASVAKKAGDSNRARQHLEAAAKIDPQQVEPYMRLAKLALDAGDERRGIAHLIKAAERTPHDRGLYRELLSRLTKQQRWDDVLRFGEMSLWNDPLNYELHLQLARAYEHQRRHDRVRFELESAALCEPEDMAAVHLAEAQYYKRANKRSQARKAARRAVEAGTKSSPAAQKLLSELGG